jgi:hypothetical protein
MWEGGNVRVYRSQSQETRNLKIVIGLDVSLPE